MQTKKSAEHVKSQEALFNAEVSVLIQKCHPYTGTLNTETSGDNKIVYLHCGDVLGIKSVSNLHSPMLRPPAWYL